MAGLIKFVTGLLSDIIRPILQEELAALKLQIQDSIERKRTYEKYDREADVLIKQIAEATTSEERWAHVRRLQDSRAAIGR